MQRFEVLFHLLCTTFDYLMNVNLKTMMKNLLKIFGVLFILLFQFTSCLKMDDDRKPFHYFYDEPVVVARTEDAILVNNESYLFYVPGLEDNTTLKTGDLLWSSFTVDPESETATNLITYPKQYTAEHFKYKVVESAKVIIPADAAEFESYLSDDYSAPIELSVLYKYEIESLWFFGFVQQDQSNQLSHTYELILNPESEDSNYPVLYIRSKQVNTPVENQAKDQRNRKVFAFDVADFVKYYREKNASTGVVHFNIKYKNGTDSNGKDVYKEFMSNPISWNF